MNSFSKDPVAVFRLIDCPDTSDLKHLSLTREEVTVRLEFLLCISIGMYQGSIVNYTHVERNGRKD